MGTILAMTKLRKYLENGGKGALARLAVATGLSHTLLSRIADGHRVGSGGTLVKIEQATGIPTRDLVGKINTTKSARKSTARKGGR